MKRKKRTHTLVLFPLWHCWYAQIILFEIIGNTNTVSRLTLLVRANILLQNDYSKIDILRILPK